MNNKINLHHIDGEDWRSKLAGVFRRTATGRDEDVAHQLCANVSTCQMLLHHED